MKGFITHTIEFGDTLQRIATKYKLDNWQEIALINNLDYPYINDDVSLARDIIDYLHSKNIKVIGDEILVPSDYEFIPEVINRKNLELQAYGCDLNIISHGYSAENVLNMETMGELVDNEQGDLKTVEGIENLKQAISLRLMTSKGSLVLHPDYGCDIIKLIGQKRTFSNIIKIKLEAERQIKMDFRVKTVKNIKVTSVDKGILLECDIAPIDPFIAFKYVKQINI